MIQPSFISASGSLQPLAVYLPVVLLLLSPLFIFISAVLRPPQGRPYMAKALLLLIIGTASLFITESAIQAKTELAENGPASEVFEIHANQETETKIIFVGLSIILSCISLIPRLLRQHETRLTSTLLPLTFLALYGVGIVFLLNTSLPGAYGP